MDKRGQSQESRRERHGYRETSNGDDRLNAGAKIASREPTNTAR